MVRSRPGQIVHETLSLKTPSQKRAGGVAQGVGPEFKPQDCKQTNKKKEKKTQIKTTVRYHLTLIRMVIIKTSGAKFWSECGEKGPLCTGKECKFVVTMEKILEVLPRLKIECQVI
jgi:hypothetical protein